MTHTQQKQEGNGPIDQRAMKASKAKMDLRFEISNLDFPCIHGHIASSSPFGCLLGHGSLQTASEAGFGLESNSVTSIAYDDISFWPLNASMS